MYAHEIGLLSVACIEQAYGIHRFFGVVTRAHE